MQSDHYPRLNPRDIVIAPDRQRKENVQDVEDLKQSIAAIVARHPESTGIIQPLVVRMVDGVARLVAGERRLRAAIELNRPEVPVRYFNELSHEEAEIIELEENVKRKDLLWRDHARAIGRIHLLYQQRHRGWKIEQTAEAISLHPAHLRKVLHVFDALETGRVDRAESIEQAYNMLHRFSERKAEAIVGNLMAQGAAIFAAAPPPPTAYVAPPASTHVTSADTITTTAAVAIAGAGATVVPFAPNPPPIVVALPPAPQAPILCTNFVEWVQSYEGPKFSLIHCDFPYGNYKGGDSTSLNSMETEEFYDNDENVYWTLLDALAQNLDRIMSYSAHMMFWFNMNFYTETVKRLRSTGLFVHDHPLIWHKTGGPGGLGVVPGTAVTYPRRTYDTALLAVRGQRPLAKPGMNSYAAPTAGNKIHPSQKPEPMLRFFLSMLVDETTTMFDPTCGSAAALRAAEDLGAKYILGIEMDPNYAALANTKTLQARVLRQGSLRREEAML